MINQIYLDTLIISGRINIDMNKFSSYYYSICNFDRSIKDILDIRLKHEGCFIKILMIIGIILEKYKGNCNALIDLVSRMITAFDNVLDDEYFYRRVNELHSEMYIYTYKEDEIIFRINKHKLIVIEHRKYTKPLIITLNNKKYTIYPINKRNKNLDIIIDNQAYTYIGICANEIIKCNIKNRKRAFQNIDISKLDLVITHEGVDDSLEWWIYGEDNE